MNFVSDDGTFRGLSSWSDEEEYSEDEGDQQGDEG